MKVKALQMDIFLGEREKNFEKVDHLISQAIKDTPDVLVLPELWDVGFFPENVLELGDENGEKAKAFLSKKAKEHNVNIVGGSIVKK